MSDYKNIIFKNIVQFIKATFHSHPKSFIVCESNVLYTINSGNLHNYLSEGTLHYDYMQIFFINTFCIQNIYIFVSIYDTSCSIKPNQYLMFDRTILYIRNNYNLVKSLQDLYLRRFLVIPIIF